MQQSSRMPAGRGAAPSTVSITNDDKQKATAEVDDFCRVLFDFCGAGTSRHLLQHQAPADIKPAD